MPELNATLRIPNAPVEEAPIDDAQRLAYVKKPEQEVAAYFNGDPHVVRVKINLSYAYWLDFPDEVAKLYQRLEDYFKGVSSAEYLETERYLALQHPDFKPTTEAPHPNVLALILFDNNALPYLSILEFAG